MRSDQNISFTCISGRRISLPTRAFDIPVGLKPLLSQLSHERREALRLNKDNLTADELTASVANLSFVDVDNSILADASTHPTGLIRVGELNAQRGRYWCEIALQIRETPALAAVDIWLLNEFDLGMARSQQRHTARLLAYALGLNYAWATEFIELSNGNRQEQLKTRGEHNLYGLHGNALLSRWPLTNGTVLRMPGMAKLFHGRPKDGDTAFGYEKRLGGRMILLANTFIGGDQITLGAIHAQTSWRRNTDHLKAVSEGISSHLSALSAKPVLIGGDTWSSTCELLGLDRIVADRSPTHRINSKGAVVFTRSTPQDDYICGRGFATSKGATRLPCFTTPLGADGQIMPRQLALSDHPFVVVALMPRNWAAKTLSCDVVFRWSNPSRCDDYNKTGLRKLQRFRDNDELRFSMRSFADADGVQNFHVIARGDPPRWLNTSFPRIFWWDETQLLNRLRSQRGISKPLDFQNSEPSKLGIALIPNLAEYFIIADDDFFLMPRPGSSIFTRFFSWRMISETPLVLPRQPAKVRFSHSPIAMLRSALITVLQEERTQTIEMVLTSGANRDQRLLQKCYAFTSDRSRKECMRKFAIDRLPLWCERMQRNNTPSALGYSTSDYRFWKLPDVLRPDGNYEEARKVAMSLHSRFAFAAPPLARRAKKQDILSGYHSRERATAFFNAVRRYQPTSTMTGHSMSPTMLQLLSLSSSGCSIRFQSLHHGRSKHENQSNRSILRVLDHCVEVQVTIKQKTLLLMF